MCVNFNEVATGLLLETISKSLEFKTIENHEIVFLAEVAFHLALLFGRLIDAMGPDDKGMTF
jgi:hypothetical protein